MRWQIEAIDNWPHKDTASRRNSSVFQAKFDATLQMLRDEAKLLGWDDDPTDPVTLRLVCDPGDIRRDGMLSKRAWVRHPGVIVQFTGRDGRMQFASDACQDAQWTTTHNGWQANVRNVALALEALRAVDRYGVTRTGEQYAGFRALPAGSGAPFSNAATALEWMRRELLKQDPEAWISGNTPRALFRHLHGRLDATDPRFTWLAEAKDLLSAAGMFTREQ